MFNPFLSENRAICEIMWKNMVKLDWRQMAIWRMPFACWITSATDTRSEYVILIAVQGQQCYANAPQCTLSVLLINTKGETHSESTCSPK